MDHDTLQVELQTYTKALPGLLANEGKFVVIHGDEVQGIFESYSDALAAGYKTNGLKPFLVKKIAATEIAQFVTRYAAPCHA